MDKDNQFCFEKDLIRTNVVANNSSEAIDQMVSLLVNRNIVDRDYAELVKQREKEYPTGLKTPGAVIALPHAFDEKVKESHVAVGVLKKAVEFQNMEDFEETLQVEIIFLLAIDEKKDQMVMLQKLMTIFRKKDLLERVKCSNCEDEIQKILNSFLEESEGGEV